MAKRVRQRLTAAAVRTAKCGISATGRPYGRLHADGGGLYLRVDPGGAKSWVFRYAIAGRQRDLGLGSAADYTLAEARERALEARKLVGDGQDPVEVRAERRRASAIAAASGMTFRECAEAYIAAHRAGWRNPKHAAQWPATLATYVYPVFGKLPVQAVDTGLVMKALEGNVAEPGEPPQPLWTAKPETASRVRGRIEAVLDWGRARGYRDGENPARWKGHLDNLLPARAKVRRVEHHAALPYAELPGFMAALRERDGLAARALEFAILTAARTGEVIGARWPEIDLDARLWTIPGNRMKAGREHRVPLSEPAAALLTARGERPFPVSNMAMLMLLRRMGRADLTVHGFRSAFSDWCAEQTNTPSEVREMALAHTVGDKVEAAYRRGDLFEKRRQLAEAWSQYCGGQTADVVMLVRSAG
ncbi:MAG: tyrosine-type recombinase/integrase [Steroidobacteraceae bacterium]